MERISKIHGDKQLQKALSEKINNQFSVGKSRRKFIRLRNDTFATLVNKLKNPNKSKKEVKRSVTRFKYYPIRSFFFHFLVVENFNRLHKEYVVIYEKIIELLSFLWQLDLARQKKFDEVVGEDYKLDAGKNYSISDIQ